MEDCLSVITKNYKHAFDLLHSVADSPYRESLLIFALSTLPPIPAQEQSTAK